MSVKDRRPWPAVSGTGNGVDPVEIEENSAQATAAMASMWSARAASSKNISGSAAEDKGVEFSGRCFNAGDHTANSVDIAEESGQFPAKCIGTP
jgi:hypothetical protein